MKFLLLFLPITIYSQSILLPGQVFTNSSTTNVVTSYNSINTLLDYKSNCVVYSNAYETSKQKVTSYSNLWVDECIKSSSWSNIAYNQSNYIVWVDKRINKNEFIRLWDDNKFTIGLIAGAVLAFVGYNELVNITIVKSNL